MRSIYIFALAFLLSACASKPKGQDESPASGLPTGEITSDTIENRVRLELQVAYAPRRAQELQEAILTSPLIQDCLRSAANIRENSFQAGLEGHLNSRGEIDDVLVKSETADLKGCLEKNLGKVAYGRGRLGPFKMRIQRVKPPEDPSQEPRGVLLELTTVKKWE